MGAYHAWAIAFPWRVIDLARTLLDAHSMPPAPAALAAVTPEPSGALVGYMVHANGLGRATLTASYGR